MGDDGMVRPKVWLAATEGKSLTLIATAPLPGQTPLAVAAREVLEHHYRPTTRYNQSRTAFAQLIEMHPSVTLEDLSTSHLRQWASSMREGGLTPATINAKLSVVGVLWKFYQMELRKVPYVPRSRALKWWLSPAMQVLALAWCAENNCGALADFILWSVNSGMRVQETLRCERQHFIDLTGQAAITVPGTKTNGAQATIPLSSSAASVALRRLGPKGAPTDRLFDVPYSELQKAWKRCAHHLGLGDNKTATLKALRRSFARHATDNGMPAFVLQKILRHASIQSTMDYLRLVGGIDDALMRRWMW